MPALKKKKKNRDQRESYILKEDECFLISLRVGNTILDNSILDARLIYYIRWMAYGIKA